MTSWHENTHEISLTRGCCYITFTTEEHIRIMRNIYNGNKGNPKQASKHLSVPERSIHYWSIHLM